MGQVLYRKYRSRSLDEVVGQDHIVTALKGAIESGRISHAYLLTGPRGTGKTSVARILAHELNGLPYSDETHFDIIEIDAASNNGVEDVRELREKVQSSPTSAKYKVYIIDEVHMLSKAAFNALLKTLEEPPEHVIFILATTEVHKLPETIISRTQRYSFRPVPPAKVIAHLKSIASKEKIDIDDDALELIAEHGEGSFRDSISLLDQASTIGGTIHLGDIERMLGRAPSTLIAQLTGDIATKQAAHITTTLKQLYDSGYEPAMISIQLGHALRGMLISSKSVIPANDILALLRELLEVPASHRPAQLLELSLLSYALKDQEITPVEAAITPKTVPLAAVPETNEQITDQLAETEEPQEKQLEPTNSADSNTPIEEPSIAPPPNQETNQLVDDESSADALWQAVLQAVKQTHNTLYGIARMAKPTLENNTITLTTKFPFHQKRLNEPKNRDILAKVTSELRGKPTAVVCLVGESAATTSTAEESKTVNVAAISNIFGSAELL